MNWSNVPTRAWLATLGLGCLGLVAVGMELQTLLKLAPCPLCIFQRLLYLVIGAIGLLVFVCVRVLGAFRLVDLRNRFARDWQLRQASDAARIEVERCAHSLPQTDTIEALWQRCRPALSLLGADEARLTLDGAAHAGPSLLWRSDSCPSDLGAAAESSQVCLHVMAGDRRIGRLIITGTVDADRLFVPERIELILRLRDLLAAQLPRLLNAGQETKRPRDQETKRLRD